MFICVPLACELFEIKIKTNTFIILEASIVEWAYKNAQTSKFVHLIVQKRKEKGNQYLLSVHCGQGYVIYIYYFTCKILFLTANLWS